MDQRKKNTRAKHFQKLLRKHDPEDHNNDRGDNKGDPTIPITTDKDEIPTKKEEIAIQNVNNNRAPVDDDIVDELMNEGS